MFVLSIYITIIREISFKSVKLKKYLISVWYINQIKNLNNLFQSSWFLFLAFYWLLQINFTCFLASSIFLTFQLTNIITSMNIR